MEKLIGFESIKSTLLTHYNNHKLHHAILLNGKKGIGKSSFAQELATEILQNKNPNNPDLLIIKKEEDKKEITVDLIRKINSFIQQTSAISQNKFIIIDSACELNKSASNALLKILEEPRPNNFLILISHNLNRVLPTIKSRCQIIKINDLSTQNFQHILLIKNLKFTEGELKFLSDICDNSPALAINLGADLTKIYQLFLSSLNSGIFNEELIKKISEKNFQFIIFEKVAEFFVLRLLQFYSSTKVDLYFNEEEIFIKIMKKFSKDDFFRITYEALVPLHKTTQLNLDKKLSAINFFNNFFK